MKKILFVFVTVFWLASVAAAPVPADSSFDKLMWRLTGGASQTVGFSSSGTPVLQPGVPLVDTDGGLPRVTSTGAVVNPSGHSVPVSVAGRVSGLNTAKAVGKIIAQNTWPLVVGFALYDLFKELGYDAVRSPAGDLAVKKVDSSICTSAPCYHYRHWAGGAFVSYRASLAASCAAVPADINAFSGSGATWIYDTATLLPDGRCSVGSFISFQPTTRQTTVFNPQSISVAPAPSNAVDSSVQEFLDSVASKSGWPSSSAVSRVLADPAVGQVEKLPVDSPVVTGPATSPGKQVVTDNGAQTTTETTVHNHTYQGDTINTTTTVTTLTVDNSTGAVINTTTKADNAPTLPKPDPDTCGLPGKPECNVKVDETGTEAAPDLQTQTKVDSALKPLTDFVANPTAALPTFPTLNFAFTLPSGCTAVSIPAFSPYLDNIDLCPFVAMFHDIMSIVWVMGGLFGAISMFFRNALATV